MSSTIAPPGHEARLVVPDVSWPVYETWVDSLPESTPVRMAYDGRASLRNAEGYDELSRLPLTSDRILPTMLRLMVGGGSG